MTGHTCQREPYGSETLAGVALATLQRRYPDTRVAIAFCGECRAYHLVPAAQR